MKRFHKVLSTILLVCMICAIIVPNAMATEENNVQAKLNSVLDVFPVDSYFTTDGQRGSPSDLLSILRAHGLSTRGFDQSQTCVGFAKYVWAKIFGHNITAAYRKKIDYGRASDKDTWKDAKPGDLIYFNSKTSKPDSCEHAAIVWSVSSTGVTMIDCNYKNTNQISVYTADFGNSSIWARTYCSVYRANNYDEVGGAIDKTYIITFDPTDGTVSPSTKTVAQGGALDTLPIPTRPGYTFTCWSTAKEGSGSALTADNYKWMTFDKDTTLYAHWTQDKHTHTNGAYFYSDSHPHYKFYTCTTCGEVYTDETTTNMSSCSICNLQPINGYTVTFDPNGGECDIDTMKTNAEGKLSRLPVATRSNCTFGGWRMIAGGSEHWRDVDTNTVFTKNTKVYAFWIYGQCTVYFDANGGTVAQGSKIVTAGTLYGDLPTPTRNCYKFDGWYTKASGGIRMTSNTSVESTTDHTLYAHWSADPTPHTWSAWSAWSSTPYTASSTRQVETQQVKVSDAYTEYRYGRYVDGTGRNAGFCTTTLTKLGYSGITVQYSAWTTSQYPAKEKDWTCGFCSGSHTGVHHYSNDGRAWWKEYVSPQSGSFFWEESRQTDAVYETQYRYRDLISG